MKRPQPRAAGADPGVAAADRRLRRDLHPAPGPARERLADLRAASSSALCLAAHLVLRLTLPHADPYLFPLVAVLACFGLVMVYRIDDTLARQQAQWFVVGLVLFAATIIALRDYRVLERYRYMIALGSLVLLLLPRVPGIGSQVNGAYLGDPHRRHDASSRPSSRRSAIVIFLASYLRDTRQVLVHRGRRFLGDHAAAAQALRPAARGLGRGDADAARDPRPRLVADVLRRLPGAALRGHQPAVVRGHRAGAVRARRVVLRHDTSRTSRTASTPGCTRSTRASTTAPAAATRSRSRCSRRPTAGCSGAASARR